MILPLLSHKGASSVNVETSLPAFIMGIVNLTSDSFWYKSRYRGISAAEKALCMVEEGANIIDLGSESTRPGAEYITEDQELENLIPVVQEIRRHSQCAISIDTRKKNVLEACVQLGADILNDVSALEDDEEMIDYVAKEKIPVILMHKRGKPAIMQRETTYEDVFSQVDLYLKSRVSFAMDNGISADKIIVDPGIGFGKGLQENLELVRSCGLLCSGCFPVAIGLSRKSCIGQMTGRTVQERLSGTLAAELIAVQHGANILRVHDVKETYDMLSVLGKIEQ